MSTLRTTNVIHGSSAISNIVLDNQGRAIFGPDSPAGRAALYVNAQNNRVGVNTESPAVALDVDGAINATGNVAIGGTLDVTGNVSFDGTVTSNGNVNLLGTLSVGTSTSIGPFTVQSDNQSRSISILGRSSDSIGEINLFASNGTTQLARIQTRSTHVLFSSGNNTTGLSINQSTNYVGIGSNFSPAVRLSVQDGSLTNGSILVGANYNGTGMNQNSDKLGAISFPMYQSDTYPQGFRGVMSYSSSTVNFVQIGGGTNSARSATDILFYTAPDVASNGSERMRLNELGHLGIGQEATCPLEVAMDAVSIAGKDTLFRLLDERDANSGYGGLISMGGRYITGSGAQADFGYIGGIKENPTSGNYAGALTLGTRTNGSLPVEAIRIDSAQRTLVGLTNNISPSSRNEKLQVSGGARIDSLGGEIVTFTGDGDWHDIIPSTFSNGAFLLRGTATGPGRHCSTVAFASTAFGDGDINMLVNSSHNNIAATRIEFRWNPNAAAAGQALQARTAGNVTANMNSGQPRVHIINLNA